MMNSNNLAHHPTYARNAFWMRVLWPSFLVASYTCGVFFSMFDPHELRPFGQPLEFDRLGVYTVGFLLLWGIGAISAGVALLLKEKD
ncbi:MAG TPA: hypothetical protein VFS42_05720 [Burkholderiaceae bacterium]|nr:hypothetical protein [Burkholderiaceae bacterium]